MELRRLYVSLCITKGADVFKSAIAVAPVTNWRYYDNIYTERFMQKPQDNGENYDINSPINHVEKLKGNYLLIHGTADDNVHFQNATEMVSALVKKTNNLSFLLILIRITVYMGVLLDYICILK